MLKALSIVVCGRLAATLLQSLTFVLLARDAGSQLFGSFSGALGIALFLSALSDLGLSTKVLRDARTMTEAEHRSLDTLRFGATTALVLVAVLVCSVVTGGGLIAVGAAVYVAAEQVSDYVVNKFVGLHQERSAGIFLVSRRALSLCVVVIVGLQGGSGTAQLMGLSLGAVLPASVVALRAMSIGPVSAWWGVRSEIAGVWGFWVSGMGAKIQGLDSAVVGFTAGASVAGSYAAPLRISNPLMLLSASLSSVILARGSGKTPSESRTLLRHTLWVMGLLAAAVVAMGTILGPLVSAVLGADYASSSNVTFLVVVAAALSFVSQGLLSWCNGVGVSKSPGVLIVCCAPVGLLVSGVAARSEGPVGAAWGLLVSQGLIIVGLGVITARSRALL